MRMLKQILMACGVMLAIVATSSPVLAADKISDLLNELGVPSADAGDGMRKVLLDLGDGRSETFFVRPIQLGDDPNNEELRLMQVVSIVTRFPEELKVPGPALGKLNEFNGMISSGRLTTWPGAVVYMSQLWWKTANAQTLASELFLAAANLGEMRKALEPYFKEE